MIDRARAQALTAVAMPPRLSLSLVPLHLPRVSSPLSGLGPPRRFPIGVSLVRFSIGLPLHCPHPCLQSLFLLIHLFRCRLRVPHPGSACGCNVKAVRRPKGLSLVGATVQVWRPSGHTRRLTQRSLWSS